MMSDIPLYVVPGDVRARRHIQSACTPLVMNILLPLITYSSPTRSALVRIDATSDPAPGSVTAIEQTASPRMAGSRNFFLSSCDPN